MVRGRYITVSCGLVLPALLGFASTTTFSQTPKNSAETEMKREFQTAMAAEDRGELDRAQALLFKIHREHPGIFLVDESLGLLLASRGDMDSAIRLLEAGEREQPSSDVAHANLGAAYYRLHRNHPAIAEFERAVEINPDNISSQESLGRLWMDDHRPNEAANAFLAAVRLAPQDSDLKLDCVAALLQANRLDEAQKLLSLFTDADRSARAQSLFGDLYEKKGSFRAAAESYALAAELDPSEQNVWQLGYECLRHWTFDAAVKEFQAASAKYPDSNRLRLGLGVALYGASQYGRAIPVFADLLKNEPNIPLYAELLGMSCDAPQPGNVSRCAALVVYTEAHPSDAKVATYAASWLMRYEDTSQNSVLAKDFLEHALAANPNLPEAQFQMGKIMQDGGNWKSSIVFLEHAVKLKPDYADAHYRLARAYWRTGRRQEGLVQMNLYKKFAQQQEEDLDRRLRQITTFTMGGQN